MEIWTREERIAVPPPGQNLILPDQWQDLPKGETAIAPLKQRQLRW